MDEKSVTRPAGPPGYCGAIADELERIVKDLRSVEHVELPEPRSFQIGIQPGGTTDDDVIAAVDALGSALVGKTGTLSTSGNGAPWYAAGGRRGQITIDIYRALAKQPDERDAEIEKLRARVAELEAGQ